MSARLVWRPITSDFPRRHVVYYVTMLGNGRRLSVARRYLDDGRTWLPGEWEWRVAEVPVKGQRLSNVIARGPCSTPAEGKRAAAYAETLSCPTFLGVGGNR